MPALAADPVAYTVAIGRTVDGALDGALSGSSQLVALRQKAPAGPFALVARARADLPRLTRALESFGHYAGRIGVTIGGRALADPGLPDALAALPPAATAAVAVTIDPGPVFHLRQVALTGDAPAAARAAFALRPGDPAVAARVLAAAGAVSVALAEEGYALAVVDPPEAVLVPEARALDVTLHVRAGPRVNVGPIALTGLRRVDPDYVRQRLLVHPGDLFRPSRLEAARQDLAGIGVFSGVVVRPAAAPDAAGDLPVTFDLRERKRHAVSANIAYSTDLGGSVGGTWSHRNLLGRAEQLNLSVSLTGFGGTATKGVGYDAKAAFIKPDFLRRDQALELDLEGVKQSLQAYDQTAVSAGASVRRVLNRRWTVSVGVTGIQERIDQEGTSRNYTLIGLPLSARYDSTGLANPLDDPLAGMRASATVTPTQSFGGTSSSFVILQGSASTYVDLAGFGLGRPGRTVLALRGLIGSAQGAGAFDLPPDQRFYGGGSATVRGFRYQSVGPLFPSGNPAGGAAIDAATIELRQRVWGPVGAAIFVDAAQVNASSAPFQGTLREGVGGGVRYYTPIGPVRVDVAVPLNRPPKTDSFQLYLGLGQAF